MARNGSGVYTLPAGSTVTDGDDILASQHNTPLIDLQSDANTARPIVAGGTGATTASAARTALGLDTMATQAASAVAVTGGTLDGVAIDAASVASELVDVDRADAMIGLYVTNAGVHQIQVERTGYTPANIGIGTDNALLLETDNVAGARYFGTTGVDFPDLAPLDGTILSRKMGDGRYLQPDGDGSALTGISPQMIIVADEKASGTDGGDFTSGAWQTRALNVTRSNTITGASLAANVVTLLAGTYRVSARAPAYQVNQHAAKLYDETGAADLVIGSAAVSSNSGFVSSESWVVGEFTLSGTSNVSLKHRATSTVAGTGFGRAATFGVVEVYSTVTIEKIS